MRRRRARGRLRGGCGSRSHLHFQPLDRVVQIAGRVPHWRLRLRGAGAVRRTTRDFVAAGLRLPGMTEDAETVRGGRTMELRRGPGLAAVEGQLDALDPRLAGEGHSGKLMDARREPIA